MRDKREIQCIEPGKKGGKIARGYNLGIPERGGTFSGEII